MTPSALHYIHDPLCGWCYAAGPMVAAVAKLGISVVLHGGGLWSEPTRIAQDKRAYIREADARIAAMTGVPFGRSYLDGLLMDPDMTLWSAPVTAATMAAGAVEPGADLRMLRAIQQAHYVDGRRVVETEVLVELAGAIGLLPAVFGDALQAASPSAHITATRQLMQGSGLSGFPGFLLEKNGGLMRIDHEPFYGRADDFGGWIEAQASAALRS